MLTALNYSLHTSDSVDTVINNKSSTIDSKRIESVIALHKEKPAFAKRPFTTLLSEEVARSLSIDLGRSFLLVSYGFLFLSSLILYLISIQITNQHRFALFNLLVYHFCFSVLFAFFSPIYSYDEFIQYSLLFLAFHFFLRSNYLAFVVVLSLAAIARESSLFIIPALFLYFSRDGSSTMKTRLKRVIVMGAPVLLYVLYLILFIKSNNLETASSNDLSNRFEGLYNNFAIQKRAIESLVSFILVLGLPLYFLIFKRISKLKTDPVYLKYIKAFLFTLVLNSLIVFLFTNAREARLFTLPLLFIWPVFVPIFYKEFSQIFSIINVQTLLSKWKPLVSLIILLTAAYYFSKSIYKSSLGLNEFHYFNEYLFLLLSLILVHFFISLAIRKENRA